jgi:uncharacterized protein (TIGR03790 family)
LTRRHPLVRCSRSNSLAVALLAARTFVQEVQGGGSGFNTMAVVNQASSNSLALGNYFCERRQVPPQNVLFIDWPYGNTSWSGDDFQSNLLNPLLAALTTGQLSNQIDYVVLSMDIPFQTVYSPPGGDYTNSTTAALFYGLKPAGGTNWNMANSFAASEAVFSRAKPAIAPAYSFLTTMITADSLSQAEQLVDQGVAGDGRFPAGTVVLEKTSDPLRNIRYLAFDNAIFNTRIRGSCNLLRTNSDSPPITTNSAGYQTGLADLAVAPGTFAPGSTADSMTSFGGVIFGPNSQTSLLAFIQGGAAGSYGTVAEPSADQNKFPDPQVYFYLSRGFSLAESYWQSVNVPYLGLVVGEPLAAPYARPGSGRLGGAATNTVLSGIEVLSVTFSASDARHPLQQVDLFIDGGYFQTLTNFGPRPGNLLAVALNGYPVNYTIPPNPTLGAVAAGLAAAINVCSNTTEVIASAHGDRIQLQSTLTNPLAASFYVADPNSSGATNRVYQLAYMPDSTPPRMTPLGRNASGAFALQIGFPTTLPYVIQASTNLAEWQPVLTNCSAGLINLIDADAKNYPSRFYRASWPSDRRPRLTASGNSFDNGFNLHLDGVPSLAYAIQTSTNLVDWVPVATNLSGGAMDFVDMAATNFPARFYRARLLAPTPALPNVAVLNSSGGGNLVQISGATLPYTVTTSTNLVDWSPLWTNFAVGAVQAVASASVGSADVLSTFLSMDRSTFLDAEAFGFESFSVLTTGLLEAGDWLLFTATKTNGALISLGVTNQSSSASVADLVAQLLSLINSTVSLQGSDGLIAEDFMTDVFGSAHFNLRARSAGCSAAQLQLRLTASSPPLYVSPSGNSTLTGNLPDLQSRNHLYVTAGATQLGVKFQLDTSVLADGYHELAAVAYEGSNVRTQTRVTRPILVQNSSLTAALTLLDLTNSAPVQATYHLQVAANAGNVSTIALYGTGGLLATITNQPTAVFNVIGPNLGVGLHPFYAVVQTTDGLQYRTQTQWVRLMP